LRIRFLLVVGEGLWLTAPLEGPYLGSQLALAPHAPGLFLTRFRATVRFLRLAHAYSDAVFPSKAVADCPVSRKADSLSSEEFGPTIGIPGPCKPSYDRLTPSM
jgi:hypothetical protein